MPHLPETHNKQHQGLGQRPPQDALIGTVAGLSEAFLAVLHKEWKQGKRQVKDGDTMTD